MASATVTDLYFNSVFPEVDMRFRDVIVQSAITSDSTETTDVKLAVQKPDGSWYNQTKQG